MNHFYKQLLILLYPICCFSQPDNLFEKQGLSNIQFQSVIEEKNKNNYLVLSYTGSISIGTSIQNGYWQILRIDKNGTLNDSTAVEPSFTALSKIYSIDNCYYITGIISSIQSSVSMPAIIQLDSNLAVTKKIKLDSIPGSLPYISRLIKINKQLFTGYFDFYNPGVVKFYKLTADLIKLDSTTFVGNQLQDLSTNGFNILISGYGFSMGSQFGNVQIVLLDTTFAPINSFNLDSLSYINGCGQKIGISSMSGNIYPVDTNKYIVVGHYPITNGVMPCNSLFRTVTSLIQHNSLVLNTKTSGVLGYHSRFYTSNYSGSIKYQNIFSASYVVPPNLFSNPTVPLNYCTKILLEKTNMQGNVVWSKVIGGDKYYLPIDVTATSDSGFVLYGMRYDTLSPAVANVAQAFILKFDKFGNQEFVSILENRSNTAIYALCYPSPTHDAFFVDIPFCREAEISVYNSIGALCLSIPKYTPNSMISAQSLSSGIYYCRILTNTGSTIKKLIIN